MKKSIISSAVFGALCMLASCSAPKAVPLSDLAGRWDIVAVEGTPITKPADMETPYLGFDAVNGNLSGNTGCNELMGNFPTTLPAGQLPLENVACTRMACPDMGLEQGIMTALTTVTGYKNEGKGRIALIATNGMPMLTLKKVADDISMSNLAGTWKIDEINGREVDTTSPDAPTITFNPADKTYSCDTGCNTINGQYQSSYIAVKFDAGAATMKACPDMANEDALKEVLPSVVSFGELPEGNYGFYAADGVMVLKIKR